MAEGRFPTSRHDASPLIEETDAWRSIAAGTAMMYKFCLLYIKGDWAEYGSTLGLPTWQDGLRPCWDCSSCQELLYDVRGLSPVCSPWHLNGPDDYFAGCDACERRVVINSVNLLQYVVGNLEYDRRSGSNHGLCLTRGIDELGLLVGDRLEPSQRLQDVGDILVTELEVPITLIFWRTSSEYITRHRNPLFQRDLGITPHSSLTIDVLHCIYLGVLLTWCRYVVWALIAARSWISLGTGEEIFENSCMMIRHELKHFYRTHNASHPTEKLTKIGNFSSKLLGDTSNKKLKTKGAETWGFSLYLLSKLRLLGPRVGAYLQPTFQAGLALERMLRSWRNQGTNLPPHIVQLSFDMWHRYCSLTEGNPELVQPKKHMVAHMLLKMCLQGNPQRYANWLDESLNKLLKKSCRTVSQVTFERFLLLRMQETLRRMSAKRLAS